MAVDKSALIEWLGDLGYTDIDTSMDDHIQLWESWYKGKVPSFHSFAVWNGIDTLRGEMASLQLGKTTPEQWANLLFNQKCTIAIDDGTESKSDNPLGASVNVAEGVTGDNPTADFVRMVFDENDMYNKINEYQEVKMAYGTVSYIPYVKDGKTKKVKMSYVRASGMIPLSYEYGKITELCVYSEISRNGESLVFVQLFIIPWVLDGDGARVGRQSAYEVHSIILEQSQEAKKQGQFRYEEVSDTSNIAGFEDLKRIDKTTNDAAPFVIDKPNIANNICPDSPFGIAVFANSIDSMKMCDNIFDSYNNEFVLGRKRVAVDPTAMNIAADGRMAFDTKEPLFMFVPAEVRKDGTGSPIIQEINMTIRAAEHRQGLQDAMNTHGYQVGFGNEFFTVERNGAVTATQVISENNVMFRNLKKHEETLDSALVDLIRLIIVLGVRYNLAPGLNPNAGITVKFDDSIVEDKDQEIKRMMADVSAELIRPEIYVARRYGVTEQVALQMMPKMPAGAREEGMQ